MLEMKPACERCQAPLDHATEAFVCSYECTWCPECAARMKRVCPNCGTNYYDLERDPIICPSCGVKFKPVEIEVRPQATRFKR